MKVDKTKVQFFNRATELENGRATINFYKSKGRVGFSSGAVNITNMHEGDYVHFLPFGNQYYFVVNDDPDGYLVSTNSERGDNKKLCINCARFYHFFLREFKRREGDCFYVQLSEHELDGRPLVEILTSKTVAEINK